jgi:hypothetical protein
MTTFELRDYLQTLNVEVSTAALVGLGDDEAYMQDLQDEIEAARHAYIGAAVIEIASLRAQLDAPNVG